METIKGQIDKNDLEFVKARYGNPTLARPCPLVNGKIYPHESRFLINNEIVSVFHIKPIYYETLTGDFRPLSEICDYHGNKKIHLKAGWENKVHPRFISWLSARQGYLKGELLLPSGINVGSLQNVKFTTSTFYPEASVATTAGDSQAEKENATWSGARDATSSDSVLDTNPFQSRTRVTLGGNFNIIRANINFDTSSIPDTDTIDSATISLYAQATWDDDNDAQAYIAIVENSAASKTAMGTSDYDEFRGTDNNTPLGTGVAMKKMSSTEADITSISTSAYTDFTLNSSGLNVISKTGVSPFGVAEGHDIEDVAISGSNVLSNVNWHSAEETGTSQDPKLVVIHTASTTFTPKIIMF